MLGLSFSLTPTLIASLKANTTGLLKAIFASMLKASFAGCLSTSYSDVPGADFQSDYSLKFGERRGLALKEVFIDGINRK
ncbi:hypothetical protein KIH87_04490 [Paraneptunicella aestuarii]|uniref:hypothetical protein n=1 Tax=Paraneptunicella aestuarii TaxID=2831148 RepID=UPI001E398E8D|nr:hypothetical protein [Paraneptunicella aestuarii]UAA39622.1 hypothetical protein KIH87_04490 [Paraneptunicella aestuarii]